MPGVRYLNSQSSKWVLVPIFIPHILHPSGGLMRQLTAIQTLNESEHGIDARRNPGRGPDIPIHDPARASHPVDLFPQAENVLKGTLVGRRALPIQDTRLRSECGACANRDQIPHLGRDDRTDELDHRRSRCLVPISESARHD